MLPKASAKSMKTDVNLEAIKCSFKKIIDSCRPLYSKKKKKKKQTKKLSTKGRSCLKLLE